MTDLNHRNNAEKIGIFRKCFTGLTNVYGSYDPCNGRAFQVKRPVTDQVILAHLRGQRPYGVYLLVGDRTRAVATDFDLEETWWPTQFVAAAAQYKIPAYIERSKSKGYHVWSFFQEPVLASKARLVFSRIREKIEQPDVELFPKHDVLDKEVSFGNWINAPLFGPLVRKGRTVFIDPDNLKPFPNQWDFLESIQRVPESLLDEIIELNGLDNEVPPIHSAPHTSSNDSRILVGLPHCSRRMLEEGVTFDQRVACFRLAVHLKRAGFCYDIAVAALQAWALKNRPVGGKGIITSQEIADQADDAFKKDYRSCGCDEPVVGHFCNPACPIKKTGLVERTHQQPKKEEVSDAAGD